MWPVMGILFSIHLDSLYEQSLRFTDYHTSPTCSPARAGLLSGMSPFNVGVTHTIYERERMSPKIKTIADCLQSNDYNTGIFGKWHLGETPEYCPENRGFSHTFVHGAGGITQGHPGSQGSIRGNSYFDPILKRNDTFVPTKGYVTDVLFDESLRFMKESLEEEKQL